MNAELKRNLFRTTVEAILLYGCESWTLMTKDESRLDDSYTRILRMALNVSWKDNIQNDVLCGTDV